MHPVRCSARLLGLLVAGCAGPARSTPAAPVAVPPADTAEVPIGASGELPPVPLVRGPLAIRVVYPAANAMVQASDSTFLFGSVGTGEARLAIDGHPVRVWPNGAWLAWVPLGADSLRTFHLDAWTERDSLSLGHVVRRGGWRPPVPSGVWIDSTALSPVGPVWWPRDEYLTLRARAVEGATLRLRLSDGTLVPLLPAREPEEVNPAVRAFGRDTTSLVTRPAPDRYVGVLRGRAVGPHPGPLFPPRLPRAVALEPATPPVRCASTGGCVALAEGPAGDSLWPVLEAIRGVDTVRTRWPLQVALLDTLPALAELDDDTAGTGTTDRVTVGRALPGGTYHWFLPTGTRAPVSGRIGPDLRLRLAPGVDAWVAQAEALRVGAAVTAPAVVGSLTLTPTRDRVVARIPLSARVPMQVSEADRALVLRIYGAVGDVNWIRHGGADTLVRRVRWAQETAGQVTLTFDLARPVWGYRVRWERNDLVFEIRRPPAIDEGRPLRGLLIAVDPGHPPAGANGPTGLREAEANLGVALELRRQLEAAGAVVLMTRTADVPVDLWPRIALADSAGADVLVSVHNNALPDGLNPFTSSGSSVYYNHPRSVPLARAIQQELVRQLGLRDLGVGRGDLALVRATWMPSVLTEGMFMMLPEQEAALRSSEGRRRYATAVFEGLRRFLRDAAREE